MTRRQLFFQFRTVLVLCLFPLFTVYGQINVKDSLQIILQNDTVDVETRLSNAHHLISYSNTTPQEVEDLGLNVLYPFVQKHWKEKSKQLEHLASIYNAITYSYRERGGGDKDEKERLFAEKALKTALQSKNDIVCASCYTMCASMEIKRGDVKKAHEYLYEAIKYYDKQQWYVKSSEMLYIIASSFFDIKDMDGMKRVLQQMQEYLEKDNSKQSLYQNNVIKKSYFELLLEKEKSNKDSIDYQLVDSIMDYNKRNTHLVENHLEELSPYWMHGWAYYYVAKTFDDYFPEQIDSIYIYLNIAVKVADLEFYNNTIEKNSRMELTIYISQVYAKTLFREGKVQDAYEAMNVSLVLLDELKNYKNLNEQRYVAYQFMVDYYERINRPAEALKFQKLLSESESLRYENEKVQAINDMSAKYETEKKEIRIQTLTKEKLNTQRILWLTIGLITVLLIALLIFIRFHKLRKKNLEQSIYESVLLTELKQNELEQNRKETERLQRQYDELEVQAGKHEQQAQSYDAELKRIKQQLEQKPTKTMIGKLTEWISKSVMEKNKKDRYIRQLSDLDIDVLEQGYLTADEKISNMDMKYIICFAIDMEVKDISLIFNVSPKKNGLIV